jgi:hypothetical protein
MMVEIKIFLFCDHRYFHWSQHIAAKVTNLVTDESIQLEIGGLKDLSQAAMKKCISSVTLTSEQSYSQFLERHKEFSAESSYHYRTNNCAHLIDFMLNFFFPIQHQKSKFLYLYQSVCCLLCVGSLGLKWFPSVLTTPISVFKKAKEIAEDHLPATAVLDVVNERSYLLA